MGRIFVSIVYPFLKKDQSGLAYNLSLALDRPADDPFIRKIIRKIFFNYTEYMADFFMLPQLPPHKARRFFSHRDSIKIIHDHGIGIQGSFIFGTDQDDRSVFSDVLRFIEKAHMEAALFSVLTPYPGTRIHQTLMKANRVLHTDWEKYDMNHVVFRPKNMTPKQLQDGLNWAYKRLYGYGSILKRLFPFKKRSLFYGVQNYGFRQGWKKSLDALQ